MIRQEKASIGHHIKDLVKECTFRGVDCLASLGGEDSLMTYSSFLTPKFGNCFTIYAEQEMLGRSSMTGAAYGLSLVLNIEQETYLRGGATSMVILLSSCILTSKLSESRNYYFTFLEMMINYNSGKASQNIALESIDVQSGNYSVISRQAVGARLSVQERAGLPLVDEYGVDLRPGARTSLALQVVNITRCSSIEMESCIVPRDRP